MSTISGHIVPWALPKEEIPFHVTWPHDFHFDTARITLSNNLELKEMLNIQSYDISNNIIEVTEIRKSQVSNISYFGGVITTSDIGNELKRAEKILIEFLENGKTKDSIELIARIFRPLLEVTEYPSIITLTDGVQQMPIKLRFTGFGDINIKMESKISGNIVSERQTMIQEIIRRFWLSGLLDEEDNTNETKKLDLAISPEYVKEMSVELEKFVSEGGLDVEGLTPEDKEKVKNWFADERKKSEYVSILYKRVSNLLIDIVAELISTNLSENVRLDSRSKVRAKIKTPWENMQIAISYSDALGNEYAPLELEVRIEDKREESGLSFEINTTIEHVQNDPYLNVAQMEMNHNVSGVQKA